MAQRVRLCSLLTAAVMGLALTSVLVASEGVEPQAIMQRMASAYDGIQDYTALFLKRERINGTLLPLETITLRFQSPFKVYMAWHTPHAGRVVVYIEGENDNQLLVNPGGLLRFLRLKLDPTGAMATQDVHHPIHEAGLQKTIALLVREYERGRREGQASLSFQGQEEIAGRMAYQLVLLCHADRTAGYYARRAEIWVDTTHFLPIKLLLYDWDNKIYAHYEYQHLRLNPGLGPEAFRLAPARDEPPVAQTPGPPSP